VQVAVPAGILPIVAASEPSFLTVALAEDEGGRICRSAMRSVLALAEKCTAMAIGPGWGTSADLQELASAVFEGVTAPLVIDADGLNALARTPGGFPKAPADRARIITPTPG